MLDLSLIMGFFFLYEKIDSGSLLVGYYNSGVILVISSTIIWLYTYLFVYLLSLLKI